MPLLAPWSRSQQETINYSGRITATPGTTVTASATPHSLGATFTELLPAIVHDCFWLTLGLGGTNAAATRTDTLVNVYIGATSAETLFIDSLLAGWSGGNYTTKHYQFPVFLPAGTRISAKARSITGSETVYVSVSVKGGGKPLTWVGRGIETLGQVTASSKGTDVTPGTTSEGTFTSIGTSGFEYKYVLPAVQGTIADTVMIDQAQHWDIGVGSALLKDLQDFRTQTTSAESASSLDAGVGRWTTIPSGTALQLRGQVETATAEAMDCCIYGVY